MHYQTIILEKKEGIATITLNRPEKLNAQTLLMYQELSEAYRLVDGDDETRVLVITGAGRAFSAGADVSETLYKERIQKREEQGVPDVIRSLGFSLANVRKPVIASINGYAIGIGLTLTLACDIRIASEAARFSVRFAMLGITLDYGASYFLPRLVGLGKALELTLTAKTIDAKEAKEIGLVNAVVPANELVKATHEMARSIAELPPLAVRVSKDALYQGMDCDLATQLQYEAYANTYLRGTQDTKEATRAFMEKRKPVFVGR